MSLRVPMLCGATVFLMACTETPQPQPPPHSTAAKPTLAPATASRVEPEPAVYRFDYTLTVSDGAGAPSISTHTLNLVEKNTGQIVVARNVPLGSASVQPASTSPAAPSAVKAVGAAPRQDVGFRLWCKFRLSGDAVLVETEAELSSADEMPAIRKVVLRGDVLVRGDQETVVSLSEDPHTHRRYQLSVRATPLR